MAILNAPYGKLLYLILGYTVKGYFPEYEITLESGERLDIEAKELQNGVKSQPHIPYTYYKSLYLGNSMTPQQA